MTTISQDNAANFLNSPPALRPLRPSAEPPGRQTLTAATQRAPKSRRVILEDVIDGLKRRWRRERRRRKVGRAYDMALEIARLIPKGSLVLDVGCGNGFIAHHLSAMLGKSAVGIDLAASAEAAIDYRRFDGARFPAADNSVDAVLLCYVLHHAQDVQVILSEVRRVLRDDGRAIIYEDIPATWCDKSVCWIHNQQWRRRTGPCTFHLESEWRELFASLGLEVVDERGLSRWRNLTHPVCRQRFVLRVGLGSRVEGRGNHQRTRPYTSPHAHAGRS